MHENIIIQLKTLVSFVYIPKLYKIHECINAVVLCGSDVRTFTIRKQTLWVLENKVLKQTSGSNRGELSGK